MAGNGCSKHKWEDDQENHHSVCFYCKAIGCTDPVKDPFREGELIIIKPGAAEWDSWTNRGKRNWYHRHRLRILADIKELGELKTRRKWDITTSTWCGLMKRWGVRSGITPTRPKPAENGKLPAYPEFSDSWPAEIQLKWLEVYQQIARR